MEITAQADKLPARSSGISVKVSWIAWINTEILITQD